MSNQEGEKSLTLGKRKARDVDDGESDEHGSTFFVSNLPYNVTSTDLQTVFSDLAPVRSAFVVLESNVSKGVGYVSFALKEDAVTAMETVAKDGIALNGRSLRVQWAERKPTEKSDRGKKIKSEVQQPSAPRQIAKGPKDPDAIRTIIISGLPSSVDQKTLWKKVRKCDGAESVQLLEADTGAAHALFSTPRAASQAVEKLHAHVYKGSIMSATLKKRVEGLIKYSGGVKNSGTVPSRGSRLIIRNLPWNISDQDLRALFLPFGPIYSVHIPNSVTEEGKKPKARGFAFIWFFSKKDAEQAIDGVNGKSVAPGSIAAPTMNKKERARLRRKLREKATEGVDTEVASENEVADDHEDDGEAEEPRKETEARVVAVDWALSKDRWEDAKAKDGEIDDVKGDEVEVSGIDEASRESGSESHDDHTDEFQSDNESMDVDEERPDDEEPSKPTLPAPEAGTTLFIRNVPFEATEDELRLLFRSFGPLRYARITVDPDTGRSRGTGFACFWNKEDADKAIHQSELLSRETGLENTKKNPFSLPSILTPDPSSSLAQSLVMHGRTLNVSRAVTREVAQKLKDDGERSREKADKRNLYLIREGVIFPNSPAASSLSTTEMEKRNASFDSRRALLKSNPSLYVSKTRLSIRQLPLFATEKNLKRLASYAIGKFEEEAKSGVREPLSPDELHEAIELGMDDVLEDGSSQKSKERKWKRPERETKVRQSKIVRQSDRVEAITGKGKSKGYGFLEMVKHADALRVLRWANNNPAVGELLEEWWKVELQDLVKDLEASLKKSKGESTTDQDDMALRLKRAKEELTRIESAESKKSKKTLIVEFSIENVQVVNRRNTHQKEMSEKNRFEPQGDVKEFETPRKRRRLPSKTPSTPISSKLGVASNRDKQKPGHEFGTLIGRKRRERKASKHA